MYRLLYTLSLLLCLSCTKTTDIRLTEVRKKMETSPAEALELLQSIPNSVDLNRKDRALFSLLYIQALDKNNLPIESDSLIHIALNYYKSQRKSRELAETYFYLGYYFVENSMTQEAIHTFLQAEKIALNLKEWNLLGLIYARLNKEYQKQQDWNNALKMNKLSIHYFGKCQNIKNMYLGYLNLAQTFICNTQLDSCQNYLQKAQEGFLKIQDTLNYVHSLILEGGIYLSHGNLSKAKTLLLKANGFYKNTPNLKQSLMLALIYRYENKLDSARLALSHLSNEYPVTEPGFYFTLANIEQQDHKPEKAFETLKKGYILQDSLYKNNMAHFVYRYAQLYNKKTAETENQKLALRNHLLLGGLLFLLISSLLLYFIYKNRLNKRSREMAESQMRVLETEKRITKLQELLHHLNQTPKNGSQKLFIQQIQMLKELAAANTRNIHNEKKRNAEIQTIREKYMLGEDWEAVKTGINGLYNGLADYFEEHYKKYLSESEIKICILTYCNFSIQEIATYLQISEKTVYNSRYKICKTLVPERTNSFEQILNKIQNDFLNSCG